MDCHSNRKRTLAVLIFLSCVYFLLFIPANFTGSKDPNMLIITGLEDLNGLGIYRSDEFAQFHTLTRMLTRGNTLGETLHNFLVYRYWQFGYPFFVLSAAEVLPVKVICKIAPSINPTKASMLTLRQFSILFTLAAIMLLIYMWTKYMHLFRSVFLFIFLTSIPEVFGNSLWWHPDSLTTLWVIATIFSLHRDNLCFGRWFYGAAFFCGLAAGTKVIGLYFFLAVPCYLLLGITNRKMSGLKLLTCGAAFFCIMAATILFTNPLLVLPEYSPEIFKSLADHKKLNEYGGVLNGPFALKVPKGPAVWYGESLKQCFGYWWTYLITFFICLASMLYDKKKRLLNIIVLTWVAPLSIYLLFYVANKSGRYFLPVLLPLLSCIGTPIVWEFNKKISLKKIASSAIIGGLLCAYGFQLWSYTKTNIATYAYILNKEHDNPAIEFYNKLAAAYFSKLPRDKSVKILQQSFIYVPPLRNVTRVFLDYYGLMAHRAVEEAKPDLILLHKVYVDSFTDPETIAITFDREQVKSFSKLFLQAKSNSIKGYHKLLETEHFVAFAKD